MASSMKEKLLLREFSSIEYMQQLVYHHCKAVETVQDAVHDFECHPPADYSKYLFIKKVIPNFANELNQGLQIDGSKYPTFRLKIQYFEVSETIPYGDAAFGRAIANSHLNPYNYKSLPQIFLKEEFFSYLKPIDAEGNQQVVSYPMINTTTPIYNFESLDK